jgi:signal transduction histidine kinase
MAQPFRRASNELAELYIVMQHAANRSGRLLHDDVGPLLSAAGLRLQLLSMDHPQTAEEIQRIAAILDRAFERIRAVSQELAPSPVLRSGLKNSLARLVESAAAARTGLAIKLNYKIAADPPHLLMEPACALFEAAGAAVAAAAGLFAASRIAITAQGTRRISIRVADNGRARGRVQALDPARRIAEAQGLSFNIATKQDTIVLIRYAL